MNRKELLKEIDRLYRIEQKYYWLLVELGKKRKDLKEAQRPFSEIYDEVVQKYVSELGKVLAFNEKGEEV